MAYVVKGIALTLLIVPLLLSGACGTSLVPVPLPELDEVIEALGYGLAPTRLPEGFEFHPYEVLEYGKPDEVMALDKPPAQIVYRKLNHHIFIVYPRRMPSSGGDNFLFERLGLDLQRPEDAVSDVKVNGEAAHLVRGEWSADTLNRIMKLEDFDPSDAEWDYDIYLTLYFDFELSPDERIGVMIQALFYPAEWITEKEMVKIAESLRRLD